MNAMKRFGVVGCLKCRKAFGVDLSHATSTCPRCGKKLKVAGLQVFCATDSQKELVFLVGAVNASLEEKQ